ncbi:MAG TPA: efflux RND transporter periplasmic adaptor subunit [Gammaproteobacteria bacterium]|nr:efflux RND transporter periplasmic adaptor subunit [Gammaproteobacteria bacterium]
MKILRILLPVVIIAAGIFFARYMMKTAPEAPHHKKTATVPSVEVITLQPQDYTVTVHSHGSVVPQTQSTLVAEVSGKIIATSDHFHEGNFFNRGDVLLKIDPRDYQAAVTIARSELAQQQLKLEQEEALARQAEIDWQRLGEGEAPSDLVLRKPQLASAKATTAAAQARLDQAQTNLSRTRITAPYSGRLLEKKANLGQFVAPGNPLATIYATDTVEIKLPLSDRQQQFLELPEHYRNAKPGKGPEVRLSKGENHWTGRIVRSAATVDTRSREQFVVAQVNDPYAKNKTGNATLKIGLFVDASIQGRTLHDVFVIPRLALRENKQVLLAVDNTLKLQPVKVVWSEEKQVIVSSGLAAGDQLIISPMPYASEGSPLKTFSPDTDRETEISIQDSKQ